METAACPRGRGGLDSSGETVAMIRSLSIRFTIFCTAIALYAMAGLAIADRQLTAQAVQVAAAVSDSR
jgi:hypothetical protein